MTRLAQQISKEIIEWYNEETNEYRDYPDEKAEHLDSVIDEFTDAIYGSSEVHLPSGVAKTVAQHGGEGEGSEYWVVFSVNGDTYFKVEGYYSSWEGTNWDSVKVVEVEPVQVSVTQYKPKALR